MTDNFASNAMPPRAVDEDNLRNMAILSYVLLLVASINGLTAIMAVIIAYIKKDEAAGTVWQSHMRNVIVVFWTALVAFILGLLTWPIALGIFLARHTDHLAWSWVSAFSVPILFWAVLFPIFVIWFLYRMIRGLMHASESRAF